jgi:signal transduction histidine kinase
MSHELRTPLNSIIGFSTGMLRHVAAHNLDEHQRDRVERIAASGRHLLGLVNNVLDIAKAEANEQSQQSEPFDLARLCDELAAMVEPLLQKRSTVTLEVHLAEGAPAPVLDRGKLKQILLNLLSNAAKFTDDGTITLSAVYDVDEWRFAVSDTGIGISADDQRRVFENFERVRSPGRNAEGTGLGLSICAALATAMRGTITLTSRLGVGSTFTLIVPQVDGSPGLNDVASMDSLASIDPRPLGALKMQRLLPPQPSVSDPR